MFWITHLSGLRAEKAAKTYFVGCVYNAFKKHSWIGIVLLIYQYTDSSIYISFDSRISKSTGIYWIETLSYAFNQVTIRILTT